MSYANVMGWSLLTAYMILSIILSIIMVEVPFQTHVLGVIGAILIK